MQLILTARSGSSSSKKWSGLKISFAAVTPRHSPHTGQLNSPSGTGDGGPHETDELFLRRRFDFESESMKPS